MLRYEYEKEECGLGKRIPPEEKSEKDGLLGL